MILQRDGLTFFPYTLDDEDDDDEDDEELDDQIIDKRASVADKLKKGLLENHEVTLYVESATKANQMNDMIGQMGMDMSSLMGGLMPKKRVRRTLSVKDARELLIQEEAKNLLIMIVYIKKLLYKLSKMGLFS